MDWTEWGERLVLGEGGETEDGINVLIFLLGTSPGKVEAILRAAGIRECWRDPTGGRGKGRAAQVELGEEGSAPVRTKRQAVWTVPGSADSILTSRKEARGETSPSIDRQGQTWSRSLQVKRCVFKEVDLGTSWMNALLCFPKTCLAAGSRPWAGGMPVTGRGSSWASPVVNSAQQDLLRASFGPAGGGRVGKKTAPAPGSPWSWGDDKYRNTEVLCHAQDRCHIQGPNRHRKRSERASWRR